MPDPWSPTTAKDPDEAHTTDAGGPAGDAAPGSEGAPSHPTPDETGTVAAGGTTSADLDGSASDPAAPPAAPWPGRAEDGTGPKAADEDADAERPPVVAAEVANDVKDGELVEEGDVAEDGEVVGDLEESDDVAEDGEVVAGRKEGVAVADGEVADSDDADDSDRGDDEDEDDEELRTGRKGGGLLTKQIQIDARAIIVIVAVLALLGGAYWLGQRDAKNAGENLTTGSTTATTKAFSVPKDFVPFEDKETGIKLAVPKDWTQFSTKDLDASYRLLLGVPNAKDNLRVRVNAYSGEVTEANIADQRAVVDAIFSGEKINVLAAETTKLNGLPALFYVYKFTDATGEPGFHAHFFVFQGRKMVSLVFEAVPEARYALLAPVFDQIAGSIQVTPGAPPAFLEQLTGGTGTTLPGAAPVPGATPAPPTTPPSPPATG